ncbi:hypothetical protein TRAPUB_13330 [Trametes pubescens]|uniref:Uncharacterized protein n=1 Tax=Trametes pubescens TaxID=154538 RepID=A0A1M2VRK9_TRAPU|nr:hypothetical protein TRAPUB_13330 [Trametes pubescens]
MCYPVGSIQQATSTCPMCKVFKPSASRCPHIKETCSNTTNHPRHDVSFLKNAEGYQNQGWPGCCRPPNPSEYKFIGAADWPTVSLVHHIPIPPEIKAILDGITAPRGASPLATSPTGTVRSPTVPATAPVMSRRSSTNVASPTRLEAATTKGTVASTTKLRSGGSPQQGSVSLSSNPRGAAGDGAMASLSKASTLEQHQSSRRSLTDVFAFAEKRPDPSNTTQHSPGRKHTELSGSVARRSSEQRRPSISASPPSAPAAKGIADATPQRRRTAPSTPSAPAATLPQPIRPVERPALEAVEKISLSSASSSSSGSSSETTVISDGGFTDYLSDESEAELQRQAEAKAAIQAQNQLEELEFKAARQQLAHVDLRPPKSWRTDIHSSTPRSQVPAARTTSSYGQPFGAAPAFAASAASTHSRG